MMPVVSTCNASRQDTCGSYSRASAAVTRRAGTPFCTELSQYLQLGQLSGLRGDHELAGHPMRDTVFTGELHHRRGTSFAHRGLPAAGHVVQARMDHPGVATGLMPGDGGLLLQDDYLACTMPADTHPLSGG